MLVVIISMVTFAIFYLVPRLAGATPETLAARYVGPVHGLGGDPANCREARVLRPGAGAVLELGQGRRRGHRPTTTAPEWRSARRRAWATRSAARSRCSRHPQTITRDAVAGGRGRDHLAGRRASASACISALKRGSFFDRFAMTLALAGVSLPIFWTGLVALSLFSYQLGLDATGVDVHDVHREPGEMVLRTDPALDHARAALLRAVRATHPRGHAGDHGGGLHPHRAGEGSAGNARSSSSTASGAR